MRPGASIWRAASLAVVFAIAWAASAQTTCSEAPDPADPEVAVMRCADGVVIAAEASAVRSSPSQVAAHPHVIQLDAGALVIAASASGGTFRTLTPDAVVSAGEGEWAVVAEAGGTVAATWRGEVILRRRIDDAAISLKAGDPAALAAIRPERIARLRAATLRALKQP